MCDENTNYDLSVREISPCGASSFAAMQRNQKSSGVDTMSLRRVRLVSYAVHPRTPKGNGSPAQDIPCIRRSGNRTVPASIRLPPAQFNWFVLLSDKAPAAQQLSFPLSSPAQVDGRTTRQVSRHSGSKWVWNVSLPGAGSVAVRFLSCCKGNS